jgi:hypothetical protein
LAEAPPIHGFHLQEKRYQRDGAINAAGSKIRKVPNRHIFRFVEIPKYVMYLTHAWQSKVLSICQTAR